MFLIVLPCVAETNNDSIESYKDKVLVKTAIKSSSLNLSIADGTQNEETIDYNANTPLALGGAVYYNDFGISAFIGLFNNENDSDYGKTEYTDFQFFYFFKKFGSELYFQKYQGYYLDNPESYGYKAGDSNSKRPDINAKNIGINAYYIFSDDYSFKAFMNQTERQRKWDWTFLMMGSYNYLKVNSNYDMIPDSEKIKYGDNASYCGGRYSIISVAPGVGITAPFSDFYISTAIFFGFGKSFRESAVFTKVNTKIAAGYNGDNLFTGMTCSLDSLAKENTMSLMTSSLYLEFYCGYRL